jgi:hypothetical protein
LAVGGTNLGDLMIILTGNLSSNIGGINLGGINIGGTNLGGSNDNLRDLILGN